MAKEKIEHTANHIISTFLLSNRCLKKIYAISPIHIAILRYVCDSMDINFKKRKSLSTKIYQSQLRKHCFIKCPKALRRNLLYLHKKRLLEYDPSKSFFKLGKVLKIWGFKPLLIEGGLSTPLDRRGALNPPSHSSHFSNKGAMAPPDQKQRPNVDETKQSNSYGQEPETDEERERKSLAILAEYKKARESSNGKKNGQKPN